MKHDWKYIKLGDIISPAKVVRNGANKKFPVLSITMRDGIVFQSSRFKKSIASVDTSDYKVVYNGQLVIAFPIDEGLIYTQDIVDAGIMSPAYNVWNVDFLEIDRKFLVLYLHCPFSMAYYKSKLRGTTMRRRSMPKEDLLNMPLPVPSFSVQQSIISELDKINELIRLKKEQLKDYDNLAQSIFYEMFGDPVENEKGWEVKKLSNNVQEMFLGPFGSALKVDSYVEKKDAFCMVYEQKHAIQGRLDLDNHFINEEKFNSLKRFEVKGGDFIMSCRGTIGKIYKLPNDAPKGIIHPSLMKIRIKEDVYDSTYFKYMLVKIVANESTNGNCVQMAITAKELGKKTLPLPPLSLQQLFAQRIELIEQQKAEVQRTIKDLETLLASRMQYWFD